MIVGSGPKLWRPAVGLVMAVFLAACATTGPSPSVETSSGSGTPFERLVRLAETAELSGDAAVAANFYAEALSHEPDDPRLTLRLAESLMNAGHVPAATQAFAKAVELDPDSLEAAKGYAKGLIMEGQGEPALALVRPWYRRMPDDLDLINLMGVAYDLQGQHVEAGRLYRQGLERQPGSVKLRNNYGLSLAFAGDTDRAIDTLKAVVDSPDSNVRSRQNLALAYGLAGDLEAAEQLSRIDLPAEAVENNLAYLAALTDKRDEPVATLAPLPQQAVIVRKKTPPKATRAPTPLIPIHVATSDDLMLSAPPAEPWFIDLGGFATNAKAAVRWRMLAKMHPDAVQGLNRLASGGSGEVVRLVAGAFASRAQALAACRTLGGDCRPVRL